MICWVYLSFDSITGEFDGDGKRLVAGKLRALELVEYTFFNNITGEGSWL